LTRQRKPPGRKDAPAGAPPQVEGLTWGCHTQVSPVVWAVTGTIPIGHVVAVDGSKGAGKSTLLATIASAWSGGPPIPGWTGRAAGRVLIVSTEDPWESVTYPRYLAAGGNPDMVARLQVRDPGGCDRWPHLPGEIGRVQEIVQRVGAGLLILDPADDVVTPGLSIAETAGAGLYVGALRQMAASTGCTVMCSRNHRKSREGGALDRAAGAAKFNQAARVVLAADWHPDQEEDRLLSVVSSNWERPTASQRYTIRRGANGAGEVVWLGESDVTVDSILDGPQTAAERAEWREADVILCSMIGDQWVALETVYRQMQDARISERMVRRVRTRLRVSHRRVSSNGTWWGELGPPASGWPQTLLDQIRAPQGGGREGPKEQIVPAQTAPPAPRRRKAPLAPLAPPPAGDPPSEGEGGANG